VQKLIAVLCLSVAFAACSDGPDSASSEESQSTPTPTATPTPEPTPEPVNKDASVSILGYHRFEERVRDSLALSPENLRKQMQAIKDSGIEVISMDDFLAWRRGEKSIPDPSILITIDDGYNDTYSIAWPIFKEFGYPFAFYVYTDYISAGGRSITWEQLQEMADAGVTIGNHSASHANLGKRSGKSPADYRAFLEKELIDSKTTIEEKLGIDVKTFVYPYGIFNEEVEQVASEAGYEALFTVKGTKVKHDTPATQIGRYIIQSDHPQIFRMALDFSGGGSAKPDGTNPLLAKVELPFTAAPAPGETISDRNPAITIDLSPFESIDPDSLEMNISSLGQVKPDYDATNKTVSYTPRAKLRHPNYRITLEARADGKKLKESWSFAFDPNATPPTPAEYPMPDAPQAETSPEDPGPSPPTAEAQ